MPASTMLKLKLPEPGSEDMGFEEVALDNAEVSQNRADLDRGLLYETYHAPMKVMSKSRKRLAWRKSLDSKKGKSLCVAMFF